MTVIAAHPTQDRDGESSPSSSPPPSGSSVRPVLVTVSVIVSSIGGVLLMFLGVGALFLAPLAGTPDFPSPQSEYVFIGSCFTILGVLANVSAYGITKKLTWAWRLGVVIGALEILQIAFISDLYSVLIGVAVLFLYTRRSVRQWVASSKTNEGT